MTGSFLSLGSNLGNRKRAIEEAETLIDRQIGTIVKRSSLYETEPWGFHHPVNFYNKVMLVNTDLNPEELLSHCQSIEKFMGRQREMTKYEARIIDIDILLYGNEVFSNRKLQIPHPYLHLRKFILVPLNELMPSLIHPVLKKEIRQILAECRDKGMITHIS